MMNKYQLVFDVAAPDEGDKVGAFVLGAGGTAIDSQTIGGSEWLQVASAMLDGAGNALTSTGGALDVNVTSAISVDVDHATDSVKIGDGTDFLAINNDGSINAVVSATDFDIRNLVAASDSVSSHTMDGSGNAIGSTSGAMNVFFTNTSMAVTATDLDIRDLAYTSDSVTAHQGGSWSVETNDAALANAGIESSATNVTTTSAALLASQLSGRKYLYVQNTGSAKVYIGKPGVTSANGFELPAKTAMELRLGSALSLHAVASAGTQDCRALQLS